MLKESVRRCEPIDFDFLDEELIVISYNEEESLKKNYWKLYFDGASSALGHGIGIVLINPEGEYCLFIARLYFNYTNNGTEYETCAMGLPVAIDKRGERTRSIWRFGLSYLSVTRRMENLRLISTPLS